MLTPSRRHFVEGARLNDDSMLLDAAAAAGCDRSKCAAFLSSGAGRSAVRRAASKVSSLGIRSIPTLVVNAARVVPGAARAGEVAAALASAVEEVLAGKAEARERLFGYLDEEILRD